jgi:hypothetical protein
MNRFRPFTVLLLATAFAVFQLLATAPLFHSHCESLETVVQAKHAREAPTLRGPKGALPRSTDECPACMVSGLAAVLSPGLAVFAPIAYVAAAHRPSDAAVRALLSDDLRSRAPPAL